MSRFPIDSGAGGAGTGTYVGGLLTLSTGETRGVEAIARLTACGEGAGRRSTMQRFPEFLESLRSALPAAGRLSMPARFAVSTVRAGLGVIEEGLTPGAAEPETIEIVFDDGAAIVARLPPDLTALIRRDRDIARAALARNVPAGVGAAEPAADHGATQALTSIFRYEKRNGRLRRVIDPDPSSTD